MHTFERDYDEWQRRVGSYPPYAHGISRQALVSDSAYYSTTNSEDCHAD